MLAIALQDITAGNLFKTGLHLLAAVKIVGRPVFTAILLNATYLIIGSRSCYHVQLFEHNQKICVLGPIPFPPLTPSPYPSPLF